MHIITEYIRNLYCIADKSGGETFLRPPADTRKYPSYSPIITTQDAISQGKYGCCIQCTEKYNSFFSIFKNGIGTVMKQVKTGQRKVYTILSTNHFHSLLGAICLTLLTHAVSS